MRTIRLTTVALAWLAGAGLAVAQPSAAERAAMREEIRRYAAEYTRYLLGEEATGFEGAWKIEGSRTLRRPAGDGGQVIDEAEGEIVIRLEKGVLKVEGEVRCGRQKAWKGDGQVSGGVLKTPLKRTSTAGTNGEAEYKLRSDGSLEITFKGEVKFEGGTWPASGRARGTRALSLSREELEAKLFALNANYLKTTYDRPTPQRLQAGKVEARFAPTVEFDPNGLEPWIVKMIDDAQTSIDLCVFEFGLIRVAQALVRAKERGVEIRVVYDNEDEHEEAVKLLKRKKIPAKDDAGRSNLMHNKFMVIDGKRVWTGSTNLSPIALYQQDNNALLLESAELARVYTAEFEEMFVAQQFGSQSPANTRWSKWKDQPSVKRDWVAIDADTAVQVYFAPEDGAMDRLIEEVKRAKKSIRFLAFAFTSQRLFDVIIERMNDGVVVEGIFESRHAGWADTKCGPLHAAGAKVRFDANPVPLHHKVVIIDEEVVCTGSFNFTEGADKSNDENMLIIRSEPIGAAFTREFRALFSITDPADARIATSGMGGESNGIASSVEGEEEDEESEE